MNSKRIGNIGEAYALAKLVELGIPVYQQFGDDEPADYLIIVNDKILKIQVKTSTLSNNDRVIFDLTSSTLHRNNGDKHKYSTKEVDAFICYDSNNKKLFLIPNSGNMTGIIIRYTEPRNNQKKGINYFTNYSLCVEALHEISHRDKEKVQTTM